MSVYIDAKPSAVYIAMQPHVELVSHLTLYSISRPEEATTWQNMAAIKSNILKRMDTAPTGVRVCCIKLLQRIVQVQTPGVIADPRVGCQLPTIYLGDLEVLTYTQRPEQNETSTS